MIAVLLNMNDVRLGWTHVPDDCRLLQFGGAYFVRTTDTAVMEDPPAETGVVFQATEMHVFAKIDHYFPTSNFSKWQGTR